MGNDDHLILKLISQNQERVEQVETHILVMNRELGQIIGKIDGVCKVIDNNNFWLKVIGIGTPGTTFVLWIIIQLLEKYRG